MVSWELPLPRPARIRRIRPLEPCEVLGKLRGRRRDTVRRERPWYHYRATAYTVENFPNNIPFDPWTYFSYGTANSQFGTIFDQTLALVALVLGLGNPSDELIRQVLLFAPPAIAVLVLIPTYVMGRRVGKSRFAGLASAAIVALSSGILLARSTVGFADHQVAEALFQSVAGLGLMVAFSVAQEEKPVYELLAERNVDALRRTVGWSALAGFAVGLYLWLWPPGIFLLGILGVFFLTYLSAEYLRGNSPEHVAIAGAIAAGTAGVMNLATLGSLGFAATGNSLLQPGMAFGLVAWLVFVSWLARTWDERDLHPFGYPIAQAAVLGAGTAIVFVGFPTLFDRLFKQFAKVLGFMLPQTATVGTIGETAPLADLGSLIDWHGLAPILAVAGILVILYRQWGDEEGRAEELFLVVWIAFVFSAVLTQQRFEYYLVAPLAALAAIPIGSTLRFLGSADDAGEGIETYQILTVGLIVVVVIMPMFVFTGAGGQADPIKGALSGPGTGIQGWEDSLDWMADNTPAEGTYGNPDAEAMDFTGTYARTDDFDYPDGAYGVTSWWDYGHWITALGNRIPNANPFQQGATDAARFLLAQDEREAAAALDRVDEDDATTRYATIDWKMIEGMSARPVRGKFFAPVTFHPNFTGANLRTMEDGDFLAPVLLRQRTRAGLSFMLRHTQAYYESMVVRLYRYHGSAQEPRNVVTDWEMVPIGDVDGDGENDERPVVPRNGPYLRQFPNRSAAEAYVAEDGSAQIGGIGPYPTERVPALQHYRLVQASDFDALRNGQRYAAGLINEMEGANVSRFLAQNPVYSQLNQRQMQTAALQWLNPASSAWTKIFERVPGATIAGTGPVDTDVTASVQLRIPGGRNFTYSQRATTGPDGEFTMTVPYSTTGYAQWGPDNGHTNVSVRATGPYTIRTERERDGGNVTYYQGTVNVTEAAVVGERDATATVTLEQQNRSLQSPGGGDSETGGESGPSESSDASGTATSEAVGRSIGAPAQARAAPDR
ncbi:MAG: oligosaccharyl transferase, archaeosortase A system-associated [Haloarculaceae archaeon]